MTRLKDINMWGQQRRFLDPCNEQSFLIMKREQLTRYLFMAQITPLVSGYAYLCECIKVKVYCVCFFQFIYIYCIYIYTFKIHKYTNEPADLQWYICFFHSHQRHQNGGHFPPSTRLSPSGHLVATGGTDGRVKIYEACQTSGITLLETNISPLKIGHSQEEMNDLPTIHFHGRTVSFREGLAFRKRFTSDLCWLKIQVLKIAGWRFFRWIDFCDVGGVGGSRDGLIGIPLEFVKKLWVSTISSSYCGNGASSRWWELQRIMFLFQPLRPGNCNVSQCSNMS